MDIKNIMDIAGIAASEPTIDITNITDYPVIKAVIDATDKAVTMGSSFTVEPDLELSVKLNPK
jgi:hypothetical protein